MKLTDFNVGDKGTITQIAKEATPFRRKLLAMGLTPGTLVELTRVAPLGDPVEISLRGYSLTLRKDECQSLELELV